MSSDDEAPKQAAPAAKPAMSRFLKGAGDSDSDESSDDDESEASSDEDEEAQQKPKSTLGRFVHGASSDEDSDEDVKRVVKSAKDKRLDEMEATGRAMDNALKINDWVAISTGASMPDFIRGRPSSRALGGGMLMRCPHRALQSSTSSGGWCSGSRTCRSPSLRFSSARS